MLQILHQVVKILIFSNIKIFYKYLKNVKTVFVILK